MTTWVYRPDHPKANENGFVERELTDPLGLYVISDEMAPTRHMATGRYHTSKAEFRKDTKASGCYEIGNETKHMLKPRAPVKLDRGKRRDDIRRTIWELKNGIRRENT